jgi:hypothetical protein
MVLDALLNDKRFQKIRKEVIEEPEKKREADRHADHDRSQSDGFLPRRPVHVPQFLARFRKKIFDPGEHLGSSK